MKTFILLLTRPKFNQIKSIRKDNSPSSTKSRILVRLEANQDQIQQPQCEASLENQYHVSVDYVLSSNITHHDFARRCTTRLYGTEMQTVTKMKI